MISTNGDAFVHVEQRYWMEFDKWEHFVNDDCTRSFLSLEVTKTGLAEVCLYELCSFQLRYASVILRSYETDLMWLPSFYRILNFHDVPL